MLHTVTMELGRDGSSLAYARRALDDRHAAVVLRDGDFDPKSRRRTDHHGDTDVARGYWPGNHRLRMRFASGTRTHPRASPPRLAPLAQFDPFHLPIPLGVEPPLAAARDGICA